MDAPGGARDAHAHDDAPPPRRTASCATHSRSSSDRADSLRSAHAPSPPASTPSPASSLALSPARASHGPLRRRQLSSHSSDADGSRSSRLGLARRLSQLAHQLSYGHGVDDDDARFDDGLDDGALDARALDALRQHTGARASLDPPVRRPTSVDLPARCSASIDLPARGDMDSILASSPASSMFRSRFSDLSASLRRDPDPDPDPRPDPPPQRVGMTVEQANKVIAEMAKLNDDLSAVVGNLKARQEESDHIHGLLIERAERAAQRIMFLQNRIAYLEQELEENDDELQHLRICLKAVEIQLPPHPDRELQRCIATFKHDYQALKKKRAARASLGASPASPAARLQ